MWSRFLALGPVFFVLVACGAAPRPGTAGGEQGVRDVAAAWYQAVLHDRPGQACDLMTSQLRGEFIAAARADTCQNAVRTYGQTLDDQAQSAINAKDFTVTLKGGDHATVELNTASTVTIFGVDWLHGSWLLSELFE